MSKNKRLKELERLRKLYDNVPAATGSMPSQSTAEIPQETTVPATATKPMTTALQVKGDLVWLLAVMVIMLVLLFGLNFLASATGFGDNLLKLFGGIV